MCQECYEITGFADWDTAFINRLPDSSFAVIEPAYKSGASDNKNARHLPHHGMKGGGTANTDLDLPHLRNAFARVNQIKPVTDSIAADALRSKGSTHLEKHRSALKSEGIDIDKYVTMDARILFERKAMSDDGDPDGDNVVVDEDDDGLEVIIGAFKVGQYPDLHYGQEVVKSGAETFNPIDGVKKCVLKNHNWFDIDARVGFIEKSWFNEDENRIEMQLRILDKKAIKKIKKRLYNEVSVGMMVEPDEDGKEALALRGIEVSFVNMPQCKPPSCGVLAAKAEPEPEIVTHCPCEAQTSNELPEQKEEQTMTEEIKEETPYDDNEVVQLKAQVEALLRTKEEYENTFNEIKAAKEMERKMKIVDEILSLNGCKKCEVEALKTASDDVLNIRLEAAKAMNSIRNVTSLEPVKEETTTLKQYMVDMCNLTDCRKGDGMILPPGYEERRKAGKLIRGLTRAEKIELGKKFAAEYGYNTEGDVIDA